MRPDFSFRARREGKIVAWFVALLVALLADWSLVRAGLVPTEPHPAVWHVKGPAGELYLFGSIHLLPSDIAWQTGAVEKAIARADAFVFEIPIDATAQTKMADAIAKDGMLEKGESLHAMLSPEARADLDADAAMAGLSPQSLDGLRPWLAELALLAAQLAHEKATPQSGVDTILERDAANAHKELRYLETVEEQIALIVPIDRKLELSEFQADLKEFRTETDDFPALVAAWSSGDTVRLDKLLNGEFKDQPEAKKALIDDRNRAWVPKLEAMLREPKVFFVTVGAGHLVGKNSVPALLRADGYIVEGP